MAAAGAVVRPSLGRIALGVTIGALVAFAADLVLLAVLESGLGAGLQVPGQPGSSTDLVPLGPLEVAFAVIPSAVGAGLVYALLSRRVARPARAFVVVAAIVFLLFLGGPASLAIPASEKAALVALHLASAVSIVAAILALARPPQPFSAPTGAAR